MPWTLQTLPVEITYKILDNLDTAQLFLSIENVSQRLNKILHSYRRYQVPILSSNSNKISYHLLSTLSLTSFFLNTNNRFCRQLHNLILCSIILELKVFDISVRHCKTRHLHNWISRTIVLEMKVLGIWLRHYKTTWYSHK